MTTFQVRVLSATKDAIKAGSGAQYEHLVDVDAADHVEARLVACQMAACHADDPMPLSAQVITDSTLTDEFSSPTQTLEVEPPMLTTTFLMVRGDKTSSLEHARITTEAACPMFHDKPAVIQAKLDAGFRIIGHIDGTNPVDPVDG